MKPPPNGLHSLSLPFVEELYESFLRDRDSVAPDWRQYFEQQAIGAGDRREAGGPSFEPRSIYDPGPRSGGDGQIAGPGAAADLLQERFGHLVRAYRVSGHHIARVDPLGLPRSRPPELDPEFHGLTGADMDRPLATRMFPELKTRTLREIVKALHETYCGSIGVEYMHIDDMRMRWWLRDRIEGTRNRTKLTRGEQVRILTRLTGAAIFEKFLQQKYPGAKSFSLEGAESLIPLLDLAFEKAGEQGIAEIVLAMAHRGRLNVIASVMGKSPQEVFREFEDAEPELHRNAGDVKYHLGYSTEWKTAAGAEIHISLCFNPSHLGFVGPVALGRMRAKQDRSGDTSRARGMALLIHGEAAFIGEGITQETLNLSELVGYTTGGTVHVIVNNQIGFTTPRRQAASAMYPTDIAKMLQIPIFHVNGEDPEAVAHVVRLAMDFRRELQRDVVIDMLCYRRLGHNELDEPAFTQPVMYRAIRARKSVRDGYLEHLLKLGEVTQEEADAIARQRREELERGLTGARAGKRGRREEAPSGRWEGYFGGHEARADHPATAVGKERLEGLLTALTRLPDGFHAHPKVARGMEQRHAMARGEAPLDWSAAEALAFASLATQGVRVRLSGQDSERGTFSQRHAVLHDSEDGHTYSPFQNLATDQAPVEIINSPLSEAGVLGFEYGYSLDAPGALVLWEAQFGDFINAAQVVIDQFLSSAEDKWHRLSGVVLLLPHGFEGMGPEHSSARMERFLTLAAEDNFQVVQPSTPAQYFHCLRRQALRRWRKPMIVFTPKSLLRSPDAGSRLEELSRGRFAPVLGDAGGAAASRVERVLLCTGKIYYELAKRREELGRKEVAIVRLEQLHPLPRRELEAALARYRAGTPLVWVQEEPENMGAWQYLRLSWRAVSRAGPLAGVHRDASASPATGSASAHKLEQEELLESAFRGVRRRPSSPGASRRRKKSRK